MNNNTQHVRSVDADSGQDELETTTSRKLIYSPRISSQLRSNMEAMGIESPDLQSSRNSTMTYHELGSINTDVDSSIISTSHVTSDRLIESPMVNPNEEMPLLMIDNRNGDQKGNQKRLKEEGESRLTREVVSNAVKSYMKSKIEKKAEALLDETQALINQKIEEWLKQNGLTSNIEDVKKDADNTAVDGNQYYNNNDNKIDDQIRCNLSNSNHDDAVVSVTTTPSDVAVVVSPGNDDAAFLNDQILEIGSPSPVRAFQKHTRVVDQISPISTFGKNLKENNKEDSAVSSNGHMDSASTKCSENKNKFTDMKRNVGHRKTVSEDDSNQKRNRMNLMLGSLRSSPLFSPARRVKSVRDLEHELDKQTELKSGMGMTTGTTFETRVAQNTAKYEGEVGSKATPSSKVVATLFRDGKKLEGVEHGKSGVEKTNCRPGGSGGVARVVKGLNMQGKWKRCFLSKEKKIE